MLSTWHFRAAILRCAGLGWSAMNDLRQEMLDLQGALVEPMEVAQTTRRPLIAYCLLLAPYCL